MFGCTYLGDGNPASSGNVQSVTGQTGSITEGKSYSYLYKQGPDNYVDYIGPNGGTIFFKSQDNRGRAVNYNGQSNNYRSIHSAFIFGALRNGSNTKNELMGIYMNYLLGGPEVTEQLADVKGLNLIAYPNPFSKRVTLNLSLRKDSYVRIQIYNTAGQVIRDLLNQNLTEGSHHLHWNGSDDSGKRLANGMYLLRVETPMEVINRVVILIN
ncbi:MAG TPA: T9SS type A sorting domain-containing protein [bacterium (Candidatus Stahlbacteria)]|nr:T9SS type A sorting domain-containing protein [Candidatus Stahlbacteria bacterium]